jgi:hypothetical protein
MVGVRGMAVAGFAVHELDWDGGLLAPIREDAQIIGFKQ